MTIGLLLIAAVIGIGVVMVFGAELIIGPGQVAFALPAAVLCVVPAVVSLQAALAARRLSPDAFVPVVFLGVGARSFTAVVGVVLFGKVVAGPRASPARFAEWVTAFYIVTLVVESWLLARVAAGGASPRSRSGDESDPPIGR